MTTVRDVLSASLRLLGVSDPTESLSADQAAIGLQAFNSMIDSWNTDNLLVYTINRTVFPLTIGQQSYTLGTGGTLNMARPAAIENCSILLTGATPNIEIPIKIDQDEDWQNVTVKSVSSSFPTEVYPDGGFPFNTLYFWPIPTQTCSFVLYSWNKMGSYTSINDTVTFPPGVEMAFKFNLAVILAPEFGVMPSPVVSQTAANTKQSLRKINWTPREMGFDPIFGTRANNNIGNRSRGAVVDY